MKKITLFAFLFALIPTITACQDTTHSIVAINTTGSGSGLVDISMQQLANLLDSKQPFVFESYSESCTHCKDLRPKLEKYVKENKKVIYTFNAMQITDEELYNELLRKNHLDIFPALENYYVPQIQFINEGMLTYQVSSAKFSSYTALKKILNNHFLSSNVTMIENEEELAAFESKNKNYIAYCYDLENSVSLEKVNLLINKEFAKSKKAAVLIDYVNFAGVFNNISEKYGADNFTFASLVKNGTVNKTIDYSADGSDLSDLISNI